VERGARDLGIYNVDTHVLVARDPLFVEAALGASERLPDDALAATRRADQHDTVADVLCLVELGE